VGFGDQKLVTRSLPGDVGDAGAENAGVAGQLLVDDVGDLVRSRTKLRRRDDVGEARELRLLYRVEQEEAHLDPALRLRRHAPDNDCIRAPRSPLAEADVVRARRSRVDTGGIDKLEQAAA